MKSTKTTGEFEALSPSEMRELRDFLATLEDPEAMDLSMLHGFLCALACGPVQVPSNAWLPLIYGETLPTFPTKDQAEHALSLVMRLANDVARTLGAGTCEPIVHDADSDDVGTGAQAWCLGFARGLSLDGPAWMPLLAGPQAILIVPIAMLGSPDSAHRSAKSLSADSDLIAALPLTVQSIYRYWHGGDPTASIPRLAAMGVRRLPTANLASNARTATVHRLKIQLADVKPPVWRRIEIASDAKLPLVSRAILACMGWDDSHLHAFRVGRATYGVPDRDFPGDTRSERSVTLNAIAPDPKDRFKYEYDFGDGWCHRVMVEAVVASDDPEIPRCLAGAGACPPEDCGGPYGYGELLEILADSTHEEHAERREWLGLDPGERFDPTAFDLATADAAVRRLVRRKRPASVATKPRRKTR